LPPPLPLSSSWPSPIFLRNITLLDSNLFSKVWKGSLKNELTFKFSCRIRAWVIGPCMMVGGSAGASEEAMSSSHPDTVRTHSTSPLSLALLAPAYDARLACDTAATRHSPRSSRARPACRTPILHACIAFALPISRQLTTERLPSLFPNPQRIRDAS
jgi:hypothetical protein